MSCLRKWCGPRTGPKRQYEALPFARTLAAEGGRELVVVHCVELTMPSKASPRYPIHVDAGELEHKIARQVAELSQGGVRTTLETGRATVGRAANVIAEITRKRDGDVIVVGTHGHGSRRVDSRQRDPAAAAHRPVPGARGAGQRRAR